MVMHGQNDLLEILLGNKAGDCLTPDGEINSFIPQAQRDQQLDSDDLLNIIYTNEETTLLTAMDMLDDADCAVEEVAQTVEIPQDTPSTNISPPTASEYSSSGNTEIIFQFPEHDTSEFSTIDLGFLTEVSDVNDTTFFEDSTDTELNHSTVHMSSTPFSPTSPTYSTMPPTPDTASSLGSSSSNVPSFVKEELKLAIRSKRIREGKGDLKVEFVPPPPEQLTEEEEMKRIEKREKNKLAAQKCREKKRILAEKLEAETRVLMKKQNQYKSEIQKLLDEREQLMEMVNIHKAVCPKFRAKSANF